MPEQNLTVPYPIPPTNDEYFDDDVDEEWVNQAPKGLRVPAVTGVLFLALFAVCGFWGGAVLQKHHDNKTATSRAASALSSALSTRRGAGGGGTGGTGATGFGGGTGGAAAAGRTVGTVTDVEGTTVFLTDASGNIVKVNLAPTTKISKTTTATAADIQLGQSVVVTGTTGTDGSTTAATVTIAPAGATAPAAGGATTPGGGTVPGGAGG